VGRRDVRISQAWEVEFFFDPPKIQETKRMSTAQLKETLDHLSPADRVFAAAYLHHLARSADPAWREEMDETQEAMAAGRKLSLKQVQEMHEALAERGL
jgi:hypothetical protein